MRQVHRLKGSKYRIQIGGFFIFQDLTKFIGYSTRWQKTIYEPRLAKFNQKEVKINSVLLYISKWAK